MKSALPPPRELPQAAQHFINHAVARDGFSTAAEGLTRLRHSQPQLQRIVARMMVKVRYGTQKRGGTRN
jgi:hypothetical protein